MKALPAVTLLCVQVQLGVSDEAVLLREVRLGIKVLREMAGPQLERGQGQRAGQAKL